MVIWQTPGRGRPDTRQQRLTRLVERGRGDQVGRAPTDVFVGTPVCSALLSDFLVTSDSDRADSPTNLMPRNASINRSR